MSASSTIRNRLLAGLDPDDFAALAPRLERAEMSFQSVLISQNQPIAHVIFPEGGIVSTVADTDEGRIEIGVIGREGMVGVPVLLGANRTPHSYVVQAPAPALRIRPDDLRAALRDRPSLFRSLGLYIQFLFVQVSQTAYVNVTFDIEARLARWLLMMQDRLEADELPITHEFLSAMLGVRRPGVTVATHVLEGMGAIRARRGRIEIRDRDKLMDIAGDSYRLAEAEYERLLGPGTPGLSPKR